jgi:hypothetical protein
MACNNCETDFQEAQSVAVSVNKFGSNASIHVTNQGRNIVQLLRVQVCRSKGDDKTILFFRPPPHQIIWKLNRDFINPGETVLIFTLSNLAAGTTVQAQADYTELIGRSRSCPTTI